MALILAPFSLTDGRREVKSSNLRPSVDTINVSITAFLCLGIIFFQLLTGKVVLKLDLAVEVVGGGPGFSEGDTLGLVGVLGLEITNNDTGLVVTLTVDLESLYTHPCKLTKLSPFFNTID